MNSLLAFLFVLFCGLAGLAQDSADHSPPPAVAAGTNVSVPESTDINESNSPSTPALEAAKELEAVDIPKYCSGLAGKKEEHSASLAAVCDYVLNLRKKLSNVICDRETKRYWTTSGSGLVATKDETSDEQHSDVITVHVTYRDGQEYYSDFRVDGKAVPATAPQLSERWSHGEFAAMLAGIFAPSSKTQFHYSKEKKLHGIPALVFDFRVATQNNRLYFLRSRDKIWFPEYWGSVWVDVRTSSLLWLQVETESPMRTKDEIEYSNLVLGDGTSMVLPTNSSALICSYNCTRSVTKFMHWHKFRATTNILMTPAN